MTIWILVVLMYSPGGDLVSKETYAMDTFTQCVDQARQENTKQHPMNIRVRAICKKVTI
jgi:hypothetical protein